MMNSSNLMTLPLPQHGEAKWPWAVSGENAPAAMENGKPWPKISIVTPNYNYAHYLEKTIRSVLLQNYPKLEYIVIDGGSTDNSVDVIKKYEPWITYWESSKDRGQAHAINKGFEKATGEIFAWINSDDYYLKGSLSSIANAFSASANGDVIVGRGSKIDENDKVIYTPKIPELNFNAFLDWMRYSHFMQPSCFFSRNAWETCGPLNEELNFCMDLDLWLKMAKRFEFKRHENMLSYAHTHQEAKTTGLKNRMIAETALLIYSYGGQEIARRELLSLADQLTDRESRLDNITESLLYKLGTDPFGRVYRKIMRYLKQ